MDNLLCLVVNDTLTDSISFMNKFLYAFFSNEGLFESFCVHTMLDK